MSDRNVRELLELPEPFYVTDARKVLEDYYGEPVHPVSHVCNALYAWADQIIRLNADPGDDGRGNDNRQGREYWGHLTSIRHDTMKSNLLARLLYGKEKLRTRPCPEHNGSWSGVEWFGALWPCGCQGTGWLPER